MPSRRKTREFVLQTLFAADVQKDDPRNVLERLRSHYQGDEDPPLKLDRVMDEFAGRLVEAISENMAEIDTLISKLSHNWKIHRMSLVDRNVLRLAIGEMLHFSDIPMRVSLNEAIDLGKKYGAENSAAFINGVLDRLSDLRKSGEPTPAVSELLARLDELPPTS